MVSENFKSLILYFSCFVISIVFSALYQKSKKGYNRKIYALFTILPTFIIHGFRSLVGTDYNSYVYIFNILSREKNYYYYRYLREPIFLFENKLLYRLFGNSISLFIFDALLIGVIVFLVISYYEKSISMPFAYLLYYLWIFPIFLNVERQALATCIVWFSYRFLIEKKWKRFIVCVVIAGLIHNTAFIFLLFMVLAITDFELLKKYKNYILWGIFILGILGLLFYKRIILIIFQGESVFSKYYVYFLDDGSYSVSGSAVFLLICGALILLFYRVLETNKKYNQMYLYFYLFSIICVVLASVFSYIGRLALYTDMSLIILISMVCKSLEKKFNKYIFVGFYLFVFFTYFLRIYYIVGSEQVFPYKFIWN